MQQNGELANPFQDDATQEPLTRELVAVQLNYITLSSSETEMGITERVREVSEDGKVSILLP